MKFKIGDEVRIKFRKEPLFHNKVGEVVMVDEDNFDEPYIVYINELQEDFCFSDNELVLIDNPYWNQEQL